MTLTKATIAAPQPNQDKHQAIVADQGYLESVLKQGREKAEAVANETLSQVKAALGYSVPL